MDQSKIFLVLPFINNSFEKINKLLSKNKIKTIYRPKLKLGRLFKKRNVINKGLLSNLVYKIKCKDCPSVYVGQTMQLLKKRVQQHKSSTKNPISKSSGVAEHIFMFPDHNIDFDNIDILEMEDNYYKRLFKENFHIKRSIDIMNRNFEIGTLPPTFSVVP